MDYKERAKKIKESAGFKGGDKPGFLDKLKKSFSGGGTASRFSKSIASRAKKKGPPKKKESQDAYS